MNRIYRTLWSVATQSWQAVPETAKSAGKKSKSSAAGVLASVALGFSLNGVAHAQSPPAVNQLPTGGSVARGAATISQTATAQAAAMTVNQSSQRAVINWNTFNVGSNASVNFVQPNAQAVTLNRVNDSNPSQIFGRISANGQVFLTNANGVYFSPTSSVDVGALTATTHSITDDNFMSGNYVFERNGATGKVVNEGNITAALGGYVALLAPEVQNAGVVVARAGVVTMAAGEIITLNIDGAGSLAGITTTPSAISSLVENKLAVLAPDGQIILSAVALDKLQAGMVKNSGALEANSLVNKGGKIVLEADQIVMDRNSRIEAKGPLGGGTVLVGGDWQGSGTMRQATKVTMEAGATIDASATDNGDGGKVVLWSDVSNADSVTQAHGNIKAEAGPNGGNGGKVETSGHTLNVDNIQVSTQANVGNSGEWLLDPYSISIDATAAGTTWASGTVVTAGTPSTTTYTSAATSTILASDITSALSSNNVTIKTGGTTTPNDGFGNGDINVNTNISWAANKLTLNAHGNINVNAAMTSTTTSAALELLYGQGTTTGSGSYLTMKMGTSDDWVGKINLVAGTTNFATTQGSSGTRKAYTVITALGASGSTTKTDLQGMNGDATLNYAIGSDIDASATSSWSGNFKPLFNIPTGNKFAGTFEGLGHNISNLTINVTYAANPGQGFISKTGAGAVVENIGLTNESMTGSNLYVGGIVGAVYGAFSLSNSFNTGIIKNLGANSTSNEYTGGLIGFINTSSTPGVVTIDHSYSRADVSGLKYVGGLVGYTQTMSAGSGISNSFASGRVTANSSFASGGLATDATDVGGLVGNIGVGSNFSISNSYATGAVTSYAVSGGLVGHISATSATPPLVISISKTYASGAVTSTLASSGGMIGVIDTTAGTQLSSSSNFWNAYSTTKDNAVGSLGAGTTFNATKLNTSALNSSAELNRGTFSSSGWSITGGSATWGMSSTGPYLCGIGSACLPTPIYLLPDPSQSSSTYGASPTLTYCYSTSASACTYLTGDANIPATAQTFTLVSGGVPQTTANITAGSSSGTLTLSGAPAGGLLSTTNPGSFTLTLTPTLTLSGYTFSAGNAVSYTINKAPLTVTAISPASKTYDGLTYSGGYSVTYSGFVNSENSSVLGGTLAFSGTSQTAINASATAYPITPSGLTSSNYTITFVNGGLTINAKALTVTGTTVASNKVYDGTTTATITGGIGLSGIVGSDVVTLTQAGTFSQASVGNGRTVTIADTLGGADAGNYTLTQPTGVTANITPKALTVTANNVTKTYDGLAYTGGSVTYSGFVNSETSSVLTGTVSYSGTSQSAVNASTTPYVITPGGNLAGANYSITYVDGSLTINKATLTVSTTVTSKTYDGTTTATFGAGTLSGVVTADANNTSKLALVQAGTFAQTGVGSGIGVTTSDSLTGTSAGNYTLTQPTGLTGNITAKALTVTASNVSKTYDGLTYSGGYSVTYSGFVNSETSAVLGGTLAYAGTSQIAINASATAYPITPSGLTSSNYTITFANGGLTINKAPLTVTASTVSKTYDGLTYTAGYSVAYSGFVNSETSSVLGGTLAYSGTSQSAVNASATPYVITPSGLTSGNYTITFANGGLTINKAPLTVTATNVTKTYDAVAYTGGGGVTYSGFVNSETSSVLGGTLAYSGTSQSAVNASTTPYVITPSGLTSGNYTLTFAGGNLTINKAALTVTATNVTKTYDGVAYTGGGGVTYSGFVNSQTSSVLGGTLAYSGTSQLAVNASTTPYAITPGGLTSGNYTLTFADGNLTINKATLTVTGATVSKTYDGTNVATFTGGALSGVVAADANNASKLALVQAGTFAQTGVGSGIAVTTTDSLTGTSAGNYTLTQPTLTGAITAKALTVSGTTVASKTYDGTNAATLSGGSLVGLVGSDTVTLTQAGTFSQASVGTGLTVTINDSISGNSNYTLTQPSSLTANITPKALGLSIPGATRMYNGTTSISVGTVALIGVVGSDAVSLTGGGTVTGYVDKNVGTNKTVIYTSLLLTGGAAFNYTLPANPTSNANITPAPLTIAGITAADKTYDGGTTATVNTASVATTGLIAGDVVTVAATGSFADKNAGTGKTVNLTSSYSGADAGNYTITDQTSTTASIAKAQLTVTADNVTRNIGATTPALTTSLSGFVGGETLATSGVTGAGLATTTATPTTEGASVITAAVGTLAATNYSFSNLVNGTLMVRAISVLNNSEVATLIGSQLANLTGPQMASFSTTQLQVFSWQQIASLSATQFAGLTATQLGSLSTAQLFGLSASQLSLMTPAQLSGLSSSQLASLSNAQLQALTATQVSAISIAQLSLLTPSQIAVLTGNAAALLSSQQVLSLTPDQIVGISAVQIARMTASDISSLSSSQLSALLPNQLAAIAPSSLRMLSATQIAALSIAQLSGLTPNQLASFSTSQLQALTTAQVNAISVTQLSLLTPAQIAMLTGNTATPLNMQQILALSPTQITGLSTIELVNLTASDISALSNSQLSALSPSQLAALLPSSLSMLSAAQIASLSMTQLSGLTPDQIRGFTPSQLAGFSATQLQALSATQVSAITTAQLNQLTPAQIALLTGNPATPLSLQQIMALTPAQIGAMSTVQVARLTAAELSSLGNAQLNALSLEQLASLSPASFATLSSEQIGALSLTQVTSLSPDQLRVLSPSQVASLSADEVASFDALQLAAIGIFPKVDTPEPAPVATAKYEAAIPVMTEVATPSAPAVEVVATGPALPAVTSQPIVTSSPVTPSVGNIQAAPTATAAAVSNAQTGVLAITILSGAEARPNTMGVAFEQDANTVSLHVTAAPPAPPVSAKLVFNDKLTTFMVAQTNGQMVEFQGGLINKRLIIVAPSAEAKQIARTEMNMVLAAAITSLGSENRVVLANLDGVVIDLR